MYCIRCFPEKIIIKGTDFNCSKIGSITIEECFTWSWYFAASFWYRGEVGLFRSGVYSWLLRVTLNSTVCSTGSLEMMFGTSGFSSQENKRGNQFPAHFRNPRIYLTLIWSSSSECLKARSTQSKELLGWGTLRFRREGRWKKRSKGNKTLYSILKKSRKSGKLNKKYWKRV